MGRRDQSAICGAEILILTGGGSHPGQSLHYQLCGKSPAEVCSPAFRLSGVKMTIAIYGVSTLTRKYFSVPGELVSVKLLNPVPATMMPLSGWKACVTFVVA